MFIGKTYLVHKTAMETRHIDFASLDGLVITKDMLNRYLPLLKWVGLIMVVIGTGYFFIAKFITALVFGLVAMLIARLQEKELIYGEGLNIAVYALTPALLWQLVVYFVPVVIPGSTSVYYGIIVFYLWKAIGVAKNGSNSDFAEPNATPPPAETMG